MVEQLGHQGCTKFLINETSFLNNPIMTCLFLNTLSSKCMLSTLFLLCSDLVQVKVLNFLCS